MGFTPIKIPVLEEMLSLYPDRQSAVILYNGFKYGFRINYTGPRVAFESKNLKSVLLNPDLAWEKVMNEVNSGRIAGPFDHRPISNLRVSPIGLVPKKTAGIRLITNLSSPINNSVNDFIDEKYTSVQYSSFDNAVNMIKKLGFKAEMAKMDVKSAFRLLPMYPGEFDLLGFKIENWYFIDKCLPMGCSVSCNHFERFSSFLHWVVETETGLQDIDHYLDDFLFAGAEQTNNCSKLMNAFANICSRLGVPIANEKTEGPATVISYLGLLINTEKMLIQIPKEKLSELLQKLTEASKKKKITLRQLQSLCGSLAFCTRALPAGRAFSRRLYLACNRAKMPHHYMRVTRDMLDDILTWKIFLQNFNGTSYILDDSWVSNSILQLFTDSAGGAFKGCGVYFNGKWSFLAWPSEFEENNTLRDITYLEMIPIALSVYLWGNQWHGKQILFHSDKQSVVKILNSCSSKSTRVMTLVSPIVYWFLLGIFDINGIP